MLDKNSKKQPDIPLKEFLFLFNKAPDLPTRCPSSYFALGTRKYNIFHCQLRNLASNLNQHKFLSHLSDSSMCPCGDDVEDNFHYFSFAKELCRLLN
jgi:hypothetical protein